MGACGTREKSEGEGEAIDTITCIDIVNNKVGSDNNNILYITTE